jgi:hypothetical protein
MLQIILSILRDKNYKQLILNDLSVLKVQFISEMIFAF